MTLSTDLISQFVKVTKDETKDNKGSTVYGEVVKYNNKDYVKIDGSDLLTPISSSSIVVDDGERVSILIKDHNATVTGNITSPAGTDKSVQNVSQKVTELYSVVAEKATFEQLEAEKARIDDLVADNVTIKEQLTADSADIRDLKAKDVTIEGKLTAAEANIENLETKKLDASVADIKYATVENLNATNADVHNLTGEFADFKVATVDRLNANDASIESLQTNKLDAKDADIKYANIDFSNINEAAVQKLFSDSGIIKDLIVSEGKITGELVGVTIKGDLIEGGTVVADKLVVKGEDGLYYKLNTDGVTTEAEQTEYNSLNGQVIAAKSITATKIAVDDLVAFGATIGGFKISTNSIYSGVKESVNNTTRGIYMDNQGQIAVGDSQNFIKYYKDANGAYKLEISAKSIKFGASGTSVEDAISEAQAAADAAIISSVEQFYQSDYPTSLSGGEWSLTEPIWIDGKYIWCRTKNTYGDGHTEYSPSESGVCITGNTGATGNGVKSSEVTYQASTSGTTIPTGAWSASIPSVAAGSYLWTKTVITYTNESTTTSYSVGKMGNTGAKGDTGASGKGIKSTEITYQAWSNGTSTPTGTWSSSPPSTSASKPYLWTRTIITYTDNSTSTSYSVGSTPEGIVVGGRNLLKQYILAGNLCEKIDDLTVKVGTQVGDTYFWLTPHCDLIAGETYTISCEASNVPDGCNWSFGIYAQNSNFQLYINKNGKIFATGVMSANVASGGNLLIDDWGGRPSTAPNIILTNFKLEKGNKATDWTPAPEDVENYTDNAVSDAKTEITREYSSLINETASQISLTVDELSRAVNANSDSIVHINNSIDVTSQDINLVKTTMSNIQNAVDGKVSSDEIKEWARFDGATLELGASNQPFKARLTTTELAFYQGSNKVAWISNNELHILTAIITQSIGCGNFTFVDEGSMGFSLL